MREIEILEEMRALARRLGESGDPLVQGQAAHLQGRVEGLLSALGGDVADLLPHPEAGR